jgi:hypothetical protein
LTFLGKTAKDELICLKRYRNEMKSFIEFEEAVDEDGELNEKFHSEVKVSLIAKKPKTGFCL